MIKKVVQKMGLNCSRHANNEGQAGSFIANSNNAPSNTNTNRSSQLCFKNNKAFVDRTNMVKKDSFKKRFGTEREEEFKRSKS